MMAAILGHGSSRKAYANCSKQASQEKPHLPLAKQEERKLVDYLPT